MSLNLAGFINRLMPTLSRSDLEVDLDASLEEISVVLSSYNSAKLAYTNAKFNSKQAVALTTEFYKEYGKASGKNKLKLPNGLIEATLSLFGNVAQNGQSLRKEIVDISNEVIVTQAITAAKSNVIRAVGHYYFITKFALDLLNYIYVLESEYAKVDLPKDAKPNAKQVENLHKNLWIYARLLAVYGSEPKHFIDELESISRITLPKEKVDEVVADYKGEKVDLFDNLPDGFIGSPIYTVRLIFAQWEADRYKQLKDKKKLLELRYLHLRMVQEQGGGDVNTEKEMEYLQKRITDIDYKTSKIEDGLSD